MANEPAPSRVRNGQRTIILPITEDQYRKILDNSQRFRAEWLDPLYGVCPELFPDEFGKGYEMSGHYHSKRQQIDIRRITLKMVSDTKSAPPSSCP